MTDSECLFCRIVSGEIPAEVVHDGERLLAFRDIDPRAPTHVLVIPKEHVASLSDADDGHAGVLGGALLLAARIAADEGIADGGYRTVVNTGGDGGQTVDHVHVHLLGGRQMGWPPG